MDTEDRELTGKIKETLSQHEEEYIPGAWESFAGKQKRRKKIIYFRYASALAASLILGWIIFGPDRMLVQKEGLTSPDKPLLSTSESVDTELKNSPAVNQEKIKVIDKKVVRSHTKNLQAALIPDKLPETTGETDRDSADSIKGIADVEEKLSIQEKNVINEPDQKEIKTGDTGKREPVNSKPVLSASNEEISENIKEERKVRFGVSFAPGVNATSSASSFNYSGGVNLDIALTPNIGISTGIQVEHQNVVSKSSVYNNAVPSDTKRAELVNLDIPVNITWNFHSGKSGSYYVSGGISSVAYLSEKYTTTTYRQELREFAATVGAGPEGDKIYKLEQVEATSTRSVAKPDNLDIAGRINLSIGFKREITPGLSLHIEPYLKIPVTGLATEKLRFTTSGVTCKISF